MLNSRTTTSSEPPLPEIPAVSLPSSNGDDLKRFFGYPRPQFERDDWMCLNGEWDFAIDADAIWEVPEQVRWDLKVNVPYSLETPASGVGDTGFFKAVWYRRMFVPPDLREGERIILHFGAVDTETTAWINGK